MKQFLQQRIRLLMIALLTGSSLLFSFSSKMGGDRFVLYLDHKMLFEQFVTRNETTHQLALTEANANSVVEIVYSHCGVNGKNRSITIRDEKNNILKSWHFADVAGNDAPMSFKVREILDLQKKQHSSELHLWYQADQLSAGRMLANVVAGSVGKP